MGGTAFAFDLDGTLTCEELLPLMAEELGLSAEMGTLTDLTMAGVIPFDVSFRLRCAILRAVPISRVRQIVAQVVLSPGLEHFVRTHVDSCFVVTGNLDVWIAPVVERLGCSAYSSIAQVRGDALTGVSYVMRKSEPIRRIQDRFDRVVAIGDGANDVPMFELADLGIAYGGVHDPADQLFEIADFVTYDEESLCRLLNTLSSPLRVSAPA